MMSIDVTLIPILSDNYAYVITSGDACAVVDPGEADPIIQYMEEHSLKPDIIFNTHHHGDHVAGNAKIKDKYNCRVIVPAAEEERIVVADIGVDESTPLTFGSENIQVIETPGHTAGHICFYFPDSKILFAGDTLFSMGCGRLFEGSAEDIFGSFEKFKPLPDDTLIYCGHEYTLSNAEFCVHLAPDNVDIQARFKEVKTLRDNNQPTIPTSLETERKTNLFLMAKSVNEFATLRSQKDNF